jgi:hypothetical protein
MARSNVEVRWPHMSSLLRPNRPWTYPTYRTEEGCVTQGRNGARRSRRNGARSGASKSEPRILNQTPDLANGD